MGEEVRMILKHPQRSSRVLAGVLSTLFISSCIDDGAEDPDLDSIESGGGSPAVVVAWNQLLQDIAFAEDQFLTFKGVRALAMMHIAQHDALNAIEDEYEQYVFFGRDRRASLTAAAAQAGHDVAFDQYTTAEQRSQIDSLLASQLASVPNGSSKSAGISLGQQAAAAILANRNGDSFNVEGTYTFVTGVGNYQTTPPFNGFVVQPGFRFARPFGLSSPSQFRPPSPPALNTSSYANSFNEVKSKGRVDSTTRTADETGFALWWMEFTEGSMNRLARQLIAARGTELLQATRMLAYLNMIMFDGYVSNWDSKYHHNRWRPYTAIREAANDDNNNTSPDAAWEPLRTTPPHPEYASAHSTVCATSMEVFKRIYGDRVRFTMSTTTAPPGMPTRTFNSFTAAADECATSRVMLGFHFRYATDAGKNAGRSIARHIMDRFLERD
jgi:hypothetical protein